MKLTITADRAIEVLKELVAEQGENYVYPRYAPCVYGDDNNSPSCIVGHVFYRLDEEFFWYVGTHEDLNKAGAWSLEKKGLLELDEDASLVLNVAQELQDCGYTWGDAVRAAEYCVKNSDTSSDDAVEELGLRRP